MERVTLKQKIKELKEARKFATQGKWTTHGDIYIYSGQIMVADNNEDGSVLRARGVGGGMTVEEQKSNVEFCALSANEILPILEAFEKMEKVLETYAMTNETFPEYGDLARRVLKEVNE